MQLVWFIVLIGVLILIHELGHFTLAKLFDVKVLRFSIGFGPRLLKLRRGETEYALSAIPLGGYVKLLGEDASDEIGPKDQGRAFSHKPIWQRVLIVLAGPAANLIFPAFIYFHFYIGEKTALSSTIGAVLDGQPAAGVLKAGDRIIAIDDTPVRYWDDVNRIVAASSNQELRITVERVGEERPITKIVTPRAHRRVDLLGTSRAVGMIGVAPHYQLAQIGVSDVESARPAQDGRSNDVSPAVSAGLRTFDIITSVQGRPVETYHDLERLLRQNRGEALVITYLRPQRQAAGWTALARLEPGSAQLFPARVSDGKTVRYDSGIRSGAMYLHDVEPGSPAAQAGLMPGDVITTIDGLPVSHWDLVTQALEERRDRPFSVGWRSWTGAGTEAGRGVERSAVVRLQLRTERDEYQTDSTLFVFGAEPSRAIRAVPEIPIEGRLGWAAWRALGKTLTTTGLMVRILAQLVAGRVPLGAVGGPIMIYELTGVAAARGFDQYLAMLAMVSLNLGLLNLLPVPLLDGGHLVFFGAEAIRRRPVGRRLRERASYVGMAVLGALMLLALRNDILRYWLR